MPAVLTTGASIGCGHGGTVRLQPGQRTALVAGAAVLARGDLEGKPITNCGQTGPGFVPCTLVASVTGGASVTLRVGGRPALLATVTGLTNGNPPGVLTVLDPGQTSLSAT
ncbi:hypothetical protein [Bailinhaonella thermotolerans]|uniref:DUF4280 domain-containing protein n=1 Tax=Bailinhaonella thermotolerans TaxID=1070861 RepID=A0A3A4B2R0_9ACTN|nr:hypothetical protein [Bailinhaonella thermotolerans]RJL35441.1 hypothetical protein D5H75_01095 [Bailinhaonella thermotolerans]